ncbi:hypothetical protein [Acidithrix sp. C25]|uniref:hypothetical protein n=1 Tax=Acidithrix sp. C25 TaxID=1671482 RepID=UPI00191BC6AA|nr:hypothetical protein [Acidithrix sp. C25]CAG4915601.1 unnamed protein product [Acidithrix sp. C25]
MAKMRGLLGKITMPFPLGRPTWPANVERTIPKSKLGANYDTEWARRYSVRLVRSLITDYVTKPAINIVASQKCSVPIA